MTHENFFNHITMLSIASAFGQMFIYYVLENFQPYMVAIITTIRKMITVICSIFLFNHILSTMQWVGIGIVFYGTLLEMREKFGKEKKEKSHKEHDGTAKPDATEHHKPKRH